MIRKKRYARSAGDPTDATLVPAWEAKYPNGQVWDGTGIIKVNVPCLVQPAFPLRRFKQGPVMENADIVKVATEALTYSRTKQVLIWPLVV